jgi:hypothetical protein
MGDRLLLDDGTVGFYKYKDGNLIRIAVLVGKQKIVYDMLVRPERVIRTRRDILPKNMMQLKRGIL